MIYILCLRALTILYILSFLCVLVSCRNIDKEYKLFLDACYSGNLEIVQRTLHRNKDWAILDNPESKIIAGLRMAIMGNQEQIVQHIISFTSSSDAQYLSDEFVSAAMLGRDSIVRILFNSNIPLPSYIEGEDNALITAIKWKKSSKGADGFYGYQVTFGTEEEYDSIIILLIGKGIDVNHKGLLGLSPMHVAVLYDDPKTVKTLIHETASVNIADDDGYTPLHYAKKYDVNQAIIELLVKSGARE